MLATNESEYTYQLCFMKYLNVHSKAIKRQTTLWCPRFLTIVASVWDTNIYKVVICLPLYEHWYRLFAVCYGVLSILLLLASRDCFILSRLITVYANLLCLQVIFYEKWQKKGSCREILPVSYTHLDVYKRQVDISADLEKGNWQYTKFSHSDKFWRKVGNVSYKPITSS